MNVSIIIATMARPSLATTLASIAAEILPDDEVIVIGDGRQPAAAEMFCATGLPGFYLDGPAGHEWGHPQRNCAMPLASNELLAFMDDDDVYLPGAFAAIRASDPDALNVFRMRTPKKTLWQTRQLAMGNLSTQMLVVPNRPQSLGEWGLRYQGDFDFATGTAARLGRVHWHETIIASYRP